MPIDEGHYKPIITKDAFNKNCIQYENMGSEGKDKDLLVEKYLDKIKPYLSDMVDNHKLKEKNGEFILVIK